MRLAACSENDEPYRKFRTFIFYTLERANNRVNSVLPDQARGCKNDALGAGKPKMFSYSLQFLFRYFTAEIININAVRNHISRALIIETAGDIQKIRGNGGNEIAHSERIPQSENIHEVKTRPPQMLFGVPFLQCQNIRSSWEEKLKRACRNRSV